MGEGAGPTRHLQSLSVPTLAQPPRHKPRPKLQEANLRWLSPSTLEKGPHGCAEGRQGYLACTPAHPKLPLLPSSSQGQLPCIIMVCAGSGARWIPCPPSATQQHPLQRYLHGPLQLLVLDGAVQRLQREEWGSAGQGCQAGGLLQGTEEACQTGSGTLEVKVTPCQFVPAQICAS